ncbi:fungal-specific transcription factor domain-containing protein [Xylogone sp. PMI_703]|nr:fungal-specific transcription factor domain-containing protein [Xylogone sp. PMI_703]
MDLVKEIERLCQKAAIDVRFNLPSCIALERYYTTFFDSFVIHVPCVHAQSWRTDTAHPSVLLGMAAIGANYQYEKDIAYNFHRVARLSIIDYIESSAFKTNRPVWLMQSMFFTMAYGAWSGKYDLVQETLSMQSTLGHVWRNSDCPEIGAAGNSSENDWLLVETWRRTKFVVYTFLSNLTITFNVPPILVNSEIHLELPCTAREWDASTPQVLMDYHKQFRTNPPTFRETLNKLLSPNLNDEITCSAFGLYVMIHALMQQIWHTRQASLSNEVTEITSLEAALKKWRMAWATNSESSLSPHSPHGPLAFNSSTLLRLAYVRLCGDFSKVNAAVTSQSIDHIAGSMRAQSGDIARSPSRTISALHAIHALRIPVKIGINQVARTGMLVWSLQHYLYAFECSLFLSKWLSDIHTAFSEGTWTEDERRVEALVRETLEEVDLDPSILEKPWNSRLMYAWAKMFDCLEIWGITSILGLSCVQYADNIEHTTV